MSIISGQDSRIQIGLADTWRSPSLARQRLPYTTEGFKGMPNYKESDALVGASGITSMAIMSYKADGSFTSYLPPDLLKVLLFCALGYEAPLGAANGDGQYEHVYKPVSAGACANLPSLTVEVDRLMEKAIYLNYKLGTWKISGKAEDYVMFDCDGPAYKEDIQTVLAKFVGASYAGGPPITVTAPAGVVTVDDEFNGKILRAQLTCGDVIYFTVTDCVAATGVITLGTAAIWGTTAQSLDGWTCEIVDWEMAPNVPLSSLEYLRFVHGYLYMDTPLADYRTLGTGGGVAADTVVDIPATLTGAAGLEIEVEAKDPQGIPRVYKYIGAAITRSTTILTFADTPVGADNIKSIFTGAGALNDTFWEVVEDMYDEVTDFNLGGDNKMADGKFGMNSSMFQSEVNPTSRDFTLDLTARFTKRLSELRKKRMMTGAPVHLKLVFETRIADGPDGEVLTSFDSTGHPYKVVIEMKKAYYVDGIPNITGPDEPTVSPKFRLAETPGVHKAIEVSVFDDVNAKVSGVGGSWEVAARQDGYIG